MMLLSSNKWKTNNHNRRHSMARERSLFSQHLPLDMYNRATCRLLDAMCFFELMNSNFYTFAVYVHMISRSDFSHFGQFSLSLGSSMDAVNRRCCWSFVSGKNGTCIYTAWWRREGHTSHCKCAQVQCSSVMCANALGKCRSELPYAHGCRPEPGQEKNFSPCFMLIWITFSTFHAGRREMR